MGEVSRMTCLDCGHRFRLQHGGGMIASIVFCEGCGRGTPVPSDAPLEPGDPDDLDPEVRRQLVELGLAGECRHCGGRLSRTARPACTRCGSRHLEKGGLDILWD